MSNYKKKRRPVPNVLIRHYDFAKLLSELVAAGYAKAQLSLQLGCTREWFYGMFEGRIEPKWTQGQIILTLHALTCGDKNANA